MKRALKTSFHICPRMIHEWPLCSPRPCLPQSLPLSLPSRGSHWRLNFLCLINVKNYDPLQSNDKEAEIDERKPPNSSIWWLGRRRGKSTSQRVRRNSMWIIESLWEFTIASQIMSSNRSSFSITYFMNLYFLFEFPVNCELSLWIFWLIVQYQSYIITCATLSLKIESLNFICILKIIGDCRVFIGEQLGVFRSCCHYHYCDFIYSFNWETNSEQTAILGYNFL